MLTWSLSSCNTITLKHPGAQRKRSQQPKMRKTRRQSRASSWLLLCSVRLGACSSGTSHVLYITRHAVLLHVTAYALPAASSPPPIHGSCEAVLRHYDRNLGRCESRAGTLLLSLLTGPHSLALDQLSLHFRYDIGVIGGVTTMDNFRDTMKMQRFVTGVEEDSSTTRKEGVVVAMFAVSAFSLTPLSTDLQFGMRCLIEPFPCS